MWTLSGFADEIDDDFETQCAHLVSLGIGHVELRSAWGTNVVELGGAQLAAVRATLQEHGLEVSSVGSPVGKALISGSWVAQEATALRAMDVARLLGAPFVRVFSFLLPPGDRPEVHRDEVLRRMSALAGLAGERDVVLALENDQGMYGDVPSRCHDVLAAVGAPALRAAWDPANFVQVGSRPFSDGYALLRPFLAYVQVKDARAVDGRVVLPGEGDGQVRETVRALRDDGFDGFFSMEPHLAEAGRAGGFSGPALFSQAVTTFTALLDDERIEHA